MSSIDAQRKRQKGVELLGALADLQHRLEIVPPGNRGIFIAARRFSHVANIGQSRSDSPDGAWLARMRPC